MVQVSLHASALPSRCITSFAVGPPVMVELPTGAIKPLPALVVGELALPHITVHALEHQRWWSWARGMGARLADMGSSLFTAQA